MVERPYKPRRWRTAASSDYEPGQTTILQGKPQDRGFRETFDIKELRRARQAYRRKHDAAAVEPERKTPDRERLRNNATRHLMLPQTTLRSAQTRWAWQRVLFQDYGYGLYLCNASRIPPTL